ncbi:MAG: hypothetical protein ACJ75J_08710 [Cytophagaceae bacterium]
METYRLLGIPISINSTFPLLPIVFCSTFFIYNVDLFVGEKSALDEIAQGRLGWRLKNRMWLKRINIFMGFVILGLSFFSSYKAFLFFAHLAIISLAYYFSLSLGSARLTPLRRIPLLKAFVITYVWTGSSVLLPALKAGISPGNSEVVLIFMERYLFLFALAIIFDIRDLRFDVKDIRTIPGLVGISKTKILSFALLLIAAVLVVFHYKDLYSMAAFELSFLLAAILIYKAKADSGEYYFLLLVDGAMVLQFLLVLLSFNRHVPYAISFLGG